MKPEVVTSGYKFAEGLRWRDGELWFVDMYGGSVNRLDESGQPQLEYQRRGFVSGLGWLSSGELLVTSMLDRRIVRVFEGHGEVYADLLGIAEYHLNDLLVYEDHCYSVNFGFDSFVGAPPARSSIVHIGPDGVAARATVPHMFPNGMVMADEGETLIVAESFGDRLLAFDRAADGSLGVPRVWAEVPAGCIPDGIAMDAEGHIWVPGAGDHHLRLVAEGGEILEDLDFGDRMPAALAFGGEDGRTLFIATSETFFPLEAQAKESSAVEAMVVDVPGSLVAPR